MNPIFFSDYIPPKKNNCSRSNINFWCYYGHICEIKRVIDIFAGASYQWCNWCSCTRAPAKMAKRGAPAKIIKHYKVLSLGEIALVSN